MRAGTPLLIALWTIACAPMTRTGAVALDGTEWTLVAVNGTSAVAGSSATLAFAGDSASGNGGCNQFRAPLTTSDATLTFGPAMSTKRACADAAMNVQETAYLGALADVATFDAAGDHLRLRDAAGKVVLEFARR